MNTEAPAAARPARWAVARREIALERPWVIASAVLVLVATAGRAAMAPVIQWAVDDGVVAADIDVVRAAALTLLAISVLTGVTGGLQTSLLARTGQRILHRVRIAAVGGLLRRPLGEFERQRRGDLVARVTTDVDKLGRLVSEAIPFATGDAVALIAALVGLFLVSPVIASMSLLVVPPMAIAGRWLQRRAGTVYANERAAVGAATGEFTETIEGLATVRAFGRQDHRQQRLVAVDRGAVEAILVGMRMRNRFSIAVTIAQASVTAVVTVTVAALASEGTLSVGAASAGLLALGSVYGPLANLLEWVDEIQSAGAALDRVVLLAAPDTPTVTAPTPPVASDHAIELDGVSFSYEPGHRVLHDVSFTVGVGEHLALVGATGAGKSTIARLIAGLAAPECGTVRVAGGRAPTLAVQEGFLLHDTVAANLRMVVPDASETEMVDAFRAMGVDDWFDHLPDGLGTASGQLSAGGVQLVNLARVVLLDPGVVILDEATSVLDEATERLVGEALDRALHGRTVVVIAHRTATAARCDRTLVVEHGRLHPLQAAAERTS